MTPSTQPSSTVFTVRCEAVFDIDAAARAWEQIANLDPGTDVMLDFTQTQVLHDVAFAALLESVSRVGRLVRTRGLARHHETLDRYLARAEANRSPARSAS